MFNLCTGYFLSQRAFESSAAGRLTDPDNVAKDKIETYLAGTLGSASSTSTM